MDRQESCHPIDKWLPWMIASVFVVLAIVLFDFVHIAFATFNGTVTDKAYERGLAYDAEIAARAAQLRSGLQPDMKLKPLGGKRVRVQLSVSSARGEPMLPAQAEVRFVRPAQAGLDRTVTLKATDSILAGDVALPAAGVWDVVATMRAGGVMLETSQRIVL